MDVWRQFGPFFLQNRTALCHLRGQIPQCEGEDQLVELCKNCEMEVSKCYRTRMCQPETTLKYKITDYGFELIYFAKIVILFYAMCRGHSPVLVEQSRSTLVKISRSPPLS